MRKTLHIRKIESTERVTAEECVVHARMCVCVAAY